MRPEWLLPVTEGAVFVPVDGMKIALKSKKS